MVEPVLAAPVETEHSSASNGGLDECSDTHGALITNRLTCALSFAAGGAFAACVCSDGLCCRFTPTIAHSYGRLCFEWNGTTGRPSAHSFSHAHVSIGCRHTHWAVHAYVHTLSAVCEACFRDSALRQWRLLLRLLTHSRVGTHLLLTGACLRYCLRAYLEAPTRQQLGHNERAHLRMRSDSP